MESKESKENKDKKESKENKKSKESKYKEQKMDKKKDLYKILLLGDSTVGKTDILFRYVENSFREICLYHY